MPGLVSLEEALAQPVVSLHTPLTTTGPYPTRLMISGSRLNQMPGGGLLVNAARGDVVSGGDLMTAIEAGQVHAALDVGPGEPDIDLRLLAAATVATPHVAGHSLDGKLLGTRMIYTAFCNALDLAPVIIPDLPVTPFHLRHSRARGSEPLILQAVLEACGVERDDFALRQQAGQPGFFDGLRRNYPQRREFQFLSLAQSDALPATQLRSLGFRL